MKKLFIALLLISTSFVAGQSTSSKRNSTGFQSWGIGGGLSLVVPNSGWGTIYSNENIGPGTDINGVVRWRLGRGGSIHYTPTINWWGRWDSWGNEGKETHVDLYDWELSMNISDIRYVPPVPKNLVVQPYIGLGLLSFTIYQFEEVVGKYHRPNWWHTTYAGDYWYLNGGGFYDKKTDFRVAQTFTLGAEFQLRSDLQPYFEFKLTNGNVSDFSMTLGFTVRGR